MMAEIDTAALDRAVAALRAELRGERSGRSPLTNDGTEAWTRYRPVLEAANDLIFAAQGALAALAPTEHRAEIRYQEGALDEVVVSSCTVHLEQMDADSWWLGITRPGNAGDIRIMLWINEQREIEAMAEDEDFGCVVTHDGEVA